jgi:hypothetical protein
MTVPVLENSLRFEDDGPCVLVGDHVRRTVHQGALDVAREVGFAVHVRRYSGT